MSTYYELQNGNVFHVEKNMEIPNNPTNSHYAKFLKWLKEDGNEVIAKAPSEFHFFDADKEQWNFNHQLAINTLSSEIDVTADLQRQSVSPMKEITYQKKLMDAMAFKNAGYTPIDGAGYPYVQAERDAMRVVDPGANARSAADAIIFKSNEFDGFNAKIERVRRVGKETLKRETNINKMKKVAGKTVKELKNIR